MSLTQWTAFVEVCRAGTFRAAAEVTGFTQPALSRQVAALERDLGVSLFVRNSRGVSPTPAGEALLPHARLVVNEARRGADAARQAREGQPRLVLGAVPSAAASLVPRAIQSMMMSEPNLEWTIVSGLTPRLVEMVLSQEIDAAVVTDAPPGFPATKELVATHLFDDEMVIVAPLEHRLGNRSLVNMADLAGEIWIEDNAGSESLLRQLAVRAGFEPRLHRSAQDLPTKTGLVAASLGVALIPQLLVPSLRSDLALLRLEQPAYRGIYLLTRREDRSLDTLRTALLTSRPA
ncbi:LysR family transcriptional regulator [Kribbella deserti]|uniref:LysR family transcriptional regulator n=1 Tax=Kribbella deserti TaxID=1926257 RepID=A0ABV6QFF4_9ACTN